MVLLVFCINIKFVYFVNGSLLAINLKVLAVMWSVACNEVFTDMGHLFYNVVRWAIATAADIILNVVFHRYVG